MCRQIAFIPTATCAEAPELQIFRVLPGPRKGDVKRTRPPPCQVSIRNTITFIISCVPGVPNITGKSASKLRICVVWFVPDPQM